MELKDMSNEDLLAIFEERLQCNDIVKAKALEAELLSRLEQGENLKCCGNCKLDKNCIIWATYCDKWQSDNLTRKERVV